EGGGSNHSGVVGGQGGRGEKDGAGEAGGHGGGAEAGVGCHAACDDHGSRVDIFDRRYGAAEQFLDHGVLKRGEQVERRLGRESEQFLDGRAWGTAASVDFAREIVLFHPAQDGGFQSAEAEVERVAFHVREREFHGARIAVRGKLVNDGTAG